MSKENVDTNTVPFAYFHHCAKNNLCNNLFWLKEKFLLD